MRLNRPAPCHDIVCLWHRYWPDDCAFSVFLCLSKIIMHTYQKSSAWSHAAVLFNWLLCLILCESKEADASLGAIDTQQQLLSMQKSHPWGRIHVS